MVRVAVCALGHGERHGDLALLLQVECDLRDLVEGLRIRLNQVGVRDHCHVLDLRGHAVELAAVVEAFQGVRGDFILRLRADIQGGDQTVRGQFTDPVVRADDDVGCSVGGHGAEFGADITEFLHHDFDGEALVAAREEAADGVGAVAIRPDHDGVVLRLDHRRDCDRTHTQSEGNTRDAKSSQGAAHVCRPFNGAATRRLPGGQVPL